MVKTVPQICAAVAIVLTVSGCALSPGQRMSGNPEESEAIVQGSDVRMVQITSELVAAPRPPAQVPAELASYRPEPYEIQPGDTLLVTVWDHPELTTPAGSQQQAIANGRLVQPDGSFFFPYAGKMNVTGMTIEELRSELTTQLGKFLRDPQLDINVVGYGGRIALQGAFVDTAPQEYTTLPLTLAQAVGAAGINAELADISGLVLTRDGRSYPLDLDALNRDGNVAADVYLQPGDRLFLPFNDRKEVYVVGEVVRPQAINFRTSDMSLTQALGRSGGLSPLTSKGKSVYVIRGLDDSAPTSAATVYQLDASSPVAFAVGERFSLQPGDVVWVGPAGITRWNRFLTQLLPLSGILSNAAAAQYNIDGRP